MRGVLHAGLSSCSASSNSRSYPSPSGSCRRIPSSSPPVVASSRKRPSSSGSWAPRFSASPGWMRYASVVSVAREMLSAASRESSCARCWTSPMKSSYCTDDSDVVTSKVVLPSTEGLTPRLRPPATHPPRRLRPDRVAPRTRRTCGPRRRRPPASGTTAEGPNRGRGVESRVGGARPPSAR